MAANLRVELNLELEPAVGSAQRVDRTHLRGREERSQEHIALRVLVRGLLGYLAHGETLATILAEFPSLTEEDVRAVIAFAAASAAEDLPAPSPIPPSAKVA